MRGASHLVLSPLLPEIHPHSSDLVGAIQCGSWYVALTIRISSVWLNTRTGGAGSTGGNRTGPVRTFRRPQSTHAPCLQAGLLLTQRRRRLTCLDWCGPFPWVPSPVTGLSASCPSISVFCCCYNIATALVAISPQIYHVTVLEVRVWVGLMGFSPLGGNQGVRLAWALLLGSLGRIHSHTQYCC